MRWDLDRFIEAQDQLFGQVLDRLFDGRADDRTNARLLATRDPSVLEPDGH